MIPPLPAPEVVKSLELQETNNNILERVEKSIHGLTSVIMDQNKRDAFNDQENDRERPKANDNKNSFIPKFDLDFSESGLLGLATKILNKTAASLLIAGIATETGLDTAARIPVMLKTVTKGITALFQGVEKLLPSTEALTKLAARFPTVTKMIEGIGTKVSNFFGLFTKLGSILTKLPGVPALMRTIAPFMAIAGNLGRVIFGPITLVIFSIIDFVKGAVEGYDSGGILGAMKGGIIGVFNGLISKPLDLLKDIVSWASEKLGFENFSSILDSFSFESLATDLLQGIFSIGESTVNTGVKVASMASIEIPEVISNFTGWWSKNVMEPVDSMLLSAVTFGDNIHIIVPELLSDLGGWFMTNVIDPLTTKVTGIFDSVVTSIKETVIIGDITLPEIISNFSGWFVSNVISPITSFFDENMTPSQKKFISGAIEILNFPKLFVDKILTPTINAFIGMLPSVEDIKAMFADFNIGDIFTNISTSIKDSLRSMIASVIPENRFFDGVRSMLGIEGPKTTLEVQDNFDLKKVERNETLKETLNTIIDNTENSKAYGDISQKLKMDKSSLASPSSSNINIYNDNKQNVNNVSTVNGGSSGGSGTVSTRATKPSWK